MSGHMKIPRSLLFVSGEQPARFDKALAAGADLACVDLEDAVAPAGKADARDAALHWIAGLPPAGTRPAVALRINGVHTVDGLNDVLAVCRAQAAPEWLLVPKVESPAVVELLSGWLRSAGGVTPRLVALVETPLGIERATEIARAPLAALMLGGADLSVELGARFDWEGLRYARGRLLNAARAAGVQAWDVPFVAIDDEAGLVDETRRVVALGYDCKAAIHPRQIGPIHAAFMPEPDELEWAESLLAAAPPGITGAFLHRSRMVDGPVLRKAQAIVARANPNP